MKLYLNGWEADLVEEALKEMQAKGGETADQARKLLERMDNCKELQKPHRPT